MNTESGSVEGFPEVCKSNMDVNPITNFLVPENLPDLDTKRWLNFFLKTVFGKVRFARQRMFERSSLHCRYPGIAVIISHRQQNFCGAAEEIFYPTLLRPYVCVCVDMISVDNHTT
jgi:hypothetical protein